MSNRRDKEDQSRGRPAVRSNRIGIPGQPPSIFGSAPKAETSRTYDQSPEIPFGDRPKTKQSLPHSTSQGLPSGTRSISRGLPIGTRSTSHGQSKRSTSRHLPYGRTSQHFRRTSSSPPSTSPSDASEPRASSQDRRSQTFGRPSASLPPAGLSDTIEPSLSPRDRSDTPIADDHYRTPGGWSDHSTPPDKSRASSKTNTSGPYAAAVKSRDTKVPNGSGSQANSKASAWFWFLLVLLLASIVGNSLLTGVAIGADARCMIAGQCETVKLPDAALAANVSGSRSTMCTKFAEATRTSKELEQSWDWILNQTNWSLCPGSLLVHPLVRDALNQTCNNRCAIELNFAGAVPGDAEIHPEVFDEPSPLKWSRPWWRKVFVLAALDVMGGDGKWLQEGFFNGNSSSIGEWPQFSGSGIYALYQQSSSAIAVRLQRFVLDDPVVRWAVDFDAVVEQALNGSEAGFYRSAVLSLYLMESNGRTIGSLGELLVKDPDAGYLAGYRVTPACTPHTLATKVQTVGYEAQAAAWAALEALHWWETGTRILPVNIADGRRSQVGMCSGAVRLVRASVEQPEVTREWMRNQGLRLAHRMGKDMCPLIAEADSMCSSKRGCDIGVVRR